MNNFNRVFSAIKKHCGELTIVEEAPLDKVEADVEIINGMNSLYQYLDVLQDLGLILQTKAGKQRNCLAYN
jgi:hypothetical protein